MPLELNQPQLTSALKHLAPVAREMLDLAADEARRIHSEQTGVEHLLRMLMMDEECAAHRATLAAFADPETIAEEALALCEGILVVGSGASLPFSPISVRALAWAKQEANNSGTSLDPDLILRAGLRYLSGEARAALEQADWPNLEPAPTEDPGNAQELDLSGGSLFKGSTPEARRALSLSARYAQKDGRDSIAPGYLVGGALEEITRPAGSLAKATVRRLLAPFGEEAKGPSQQPLGVDESLLEFLQGLSTRPQPVDSLGLLAHFHTCQSVELTQLFSRHRLTEAFLAKAATDLKD